MPSSARCRRQRTRPPTTAHTKIRRHTACLESHQISATSAPLNTLDPRTLSQAGVHLEEPLYLAEPADTSTALTWYRTQAGPAAPLSVVLRPGPPDTRTPDSLRQKARLAQSHACAELNFYAYGLYRLQALDQIRTALPTIP